MHRWTSNNLPGRPNLLVVNVSCVQTAKGYLTAAQGRWIVYQHLVYGKVNISLELVKITHMDLESTAGLIRNLLLGNEIGHQLMISPAGRTFDLRIEALAYDNTYCAMVASNFWLEPQ